VATRRLIDSIALVLIYILVPTRLIYFVIAPSASIGRSISAPRIGVLVIQDTSKSYLCTLAKWLQPLKAIALRGLSFAINLSNVAIEVRNAKFQKW